jgi:asparagine synthase (glutamine-hydrolysing)
MCGIAGIVRFDGNPVRQEQVQAMVTSLSHRGPDDAGLLVENGVGMGMRRLSIIDLSALGHQPMENEDGSVSVVYNGEIYNFMDLRADLRAAGHQFRSHSDTEVLVHGYEEYGAVELGRRLEGMFAFALLDRARRKLFLARGPFGIKPLYLRRSSRQLSFASEIRALAHDGHGAPVVDPSFVGSFLCLGYIPSPATAFRDVVKLESGTVLEIELHSGQETQHRFYSLAPTRADGGRTDRDLVEELDRLLASAVQRHLIADVPMGVFLSGGLDSSAITSFAARQPGPAPQTFSIGFARSDRGDETAAAAEVARATGSENVRIELGPNALGDLQEIIPSLEEPLSDSAVLPLWHLCKGTSAHVKAALSGEGGDEVMGGYARYFWGWLATRLEGYPRPWAPAARWASRRLPARSRGALNFVRRAAKLADSIELGESARYLSWFEIFTDDERRSLGPYRSEACTARIAGLFQSARGLDLDPVQRLQYVDFSSMLLDNLLMKADKLSMAHSLEVRVPLLDRRLVEFGLGLPPRAKIGSRRDKPLLRRLLRSRLPAGIADRPKRGFEIPVDQWFREPATVDLRRSLHEGQMVKTLGLSPVAIRSLVDRHLGGEDLGRKLFSLATLETWAGRYC